MPPFRIIITRDGTQWEHQGLDVIGEANIVALIGLFGGICLGLAARLGRFCTLGAIEDALYGADDTRLRMWGIAIGVAIFGSFGLIWSGHLIPADTIYLAFAFQPVSALIGGVMFGYGMALAGNCGYGALARLGGGDLRSFVIVLVMGLAAFATISGPLAWLRVAVVPQKLAIGTPPGIAHWLAAALNVPVSTIGMALGLLVLAIALWPARIRAQPVPIFWGTVVGLSVVSGWAGTQWVATHGFDQLPVVSHTFAAPLGETMLYAMIASGQPLSFAVGSVLGVCFGAIIGSLFKGQFRWEACEDPRELRRQILGAALMGVGAVLAMGCSVGQGLSAMSVLAFSAPIVVIGILFGAAIGLRQLITGFTRIA